MGDLVALAVDLRWLRTLMKQDITTPVEEERAIRVLTKAHEALRFLPCTIVSVGSAAASAKHKMAALLHTHRVGTLELEGGGASDEFDGGLDGGLGD